MNWGFSNPHFGGRGEVMVTSCEDSGRIDDRVKKSNSAEKQVYQSRDEVRNDQINKTECLDGNGKEMIIEGNFSVLIFFAFDRCFS